MPRMASLDLTTISQHLKRDIVISITPSRHQSTIFSFSPLLAQAYPTQVLGASRSAHSSVKHPWTGRHRL
ncbi:hypothetical protein CBOM_07723 [Ceraceosorus bombacis]|uniref:Uncharacterized protein n=1 Tax=Ceraceosorus bombacis TaxID=401625 RepID=A0A0P1BHE0_9BASI|nr:hypothetical protein CBOM_07723 [Ceraceosorus bombacis]